MDAQVGSTVNTDSVKPTAIIGQFWNCLYKVWGVMGKMVGEAVARQGSFDIPNLLLNVLYK